MAHETPHASPTVPAPSATALAATVTLERRETARWAAIVRAVGSGGGLLLSVALTFAYPDGYWRDYPPAMLVHFAVSVALLLDLTRPRPPRLPLWLSAVIDVGVVVASGIVGLRNAPDPRLTAMMTLVALIAVQLISALVLSGPGNHSVTFASVVTFIALGTASGLDRPLLATGALTAAAMGFVTVVTSRMRMRLALRFAEAEIERTLADTLRWKTEEHARVVERLLAEAKERNTQLEQLQADNRLLTQFIVHDLRAPLTSIAGNVEWLGSLARRAGPSAEADLAVEEGLHGIDRLSGLIGSLLDASKLEEGRFTLQRESLPVAELLGRVARQSRVAARARELEVVVEPAPGDVRIDADRNLVQRVLENLAANATRYAKDGGRMRLAAEPHGDRVVLLVQNDGPEIRAEDVPKLFDKYIQSDDGNITRAPRSGWGLGLYFCRLAAEAHGGGIGVVERPGWSVSFAVTLPRAPGVTPEAGP